MHEKNVTFSFPVTLTFDLLDLESPPHYSCPALCFD